MLSVAQDLVSQLTPYQDALNTELDVMTSLPLVGEELSELQEWNTVFQDSVDSLSSRVNSLTNGHFELSIPLGSFQETFTFDLGLDAFLQVHTSGGVSATINPVLNVAFDLTNGVPSLDPTHTGLDIGFVIGLPNFQLTASLKNLLYVQADDDGTTFSGNLGFHFDTNFRIEPNFSGDAQVRLGLTLSLVDPALNASFNPRFSTALELDWGFDTQSDQLKIPVIAFRNFSLDADSFMQGFLGDTVRGVQKFTKPMQPFIDMFEQPVPIVSSFDSSETMGDLFLQGAGLSEEQQDSFNTMVKIVKAVNTFDFSGTTGGAVINFGDILLTGDARQASQFFFDTTQLQGVIDDIMNSPALQEVQEKLETVAEYVGFTADAGFKYPLLENPGQVIGSLLTGQTEVMFSYSTGRQHFELGASSGVGIPNLLGFFLNAGIVFDASLSVGYDTAGLLKFIQEPVKRPEYLLHGFYIDNSIDHSGAPIPNVPNPRKSSLYLQGHADISASAVVTVSGGIYADISFELASNSASPHVYLDDIITSLSNNVKVFNPSGRIYAAANIELTFDAPVGPDITLFKYKLSEQELLSFNLPPAPTQTLPLFVISVTDQHTLLLDVTKMTANGKVKVQPFHDFTITNDGGYSGDGIRVDYPNEIVLYVERKNDITTNYYNFIGLSGPVPDGVSIDIVDPFTVFATEGAPDPQPPQTESGVLLAGGKNVVYKYAENAGGSLATVLLVGGYGSNSLTGGTMTFGNFVPAARIDQAKNYFGNVTGFDAAGQAYINARVDSVLAPVSPSGIIGATMTGSRGGLMFGGPGNNSFYATGPGAYDMVGGAWTNNFTISPSFGGAPATFQIDGGPYGQSKLVVRVPAGDLADFENGTVPDKYDPAFKALDIYSNAGLFATAHGIDIVQASSAPGSTIVIGDTSELNIQFKLKGSGTIKFGGSNAPDDFSVTSVYEARSVASANWETLGYPTSFHGTKDRRSALLLRPWPSRTSLVDLSAEFEALFQKVVKYGPVNAQDQLGQWAWVSPKLPESQWPYVVAVPPGANENGGAYYFNSTLVDFWYPRADYGSNGDIFTQLFPAPTYTIGRTFGTNGRTQNITFELGEADSTQIILDGRGASDDYDVSLGLGFFIDVTIDDSDETTQNSLVVHYDNTPTLADRVELTDTTLNVEYATPLIPRTYESGIGIYYFTSFGSSVSYSPAVKFDANTDITFQTDWQFRETIVNRPNGPQKATLQFVNAGGITGYAFDVQVPSPQLQIFDGSVSSEIDVVTNGGNLVIDVNEHTFNFHSPTVNVHANSGTVDVKIAKVYFDYGPLVLNVYGNSGTVKLDANRYANRSGTYNINVEGNEGLVLIGSTATSGELTFNINAPASTGEIQTDLSGFSGLLTFNVLANASDLLAQTAHNSNTFNVRSNSGTVTFDFAGNWSAVTQTVNIAASTGTVNVHEAVIGVPYYPPPATTQVNVGSTGSLADISGEINLTNSAGAISLKIDDRSNSGPSASWTVDAMKTIIGDLTINYAHANPVLWGVTTYDAFPKAGQVVYFNGMPPFWVYQVNGVRLERDFTPKYNFNGFQQAGAPVSVQLYVDNPPLDPLLYLATGLPPGLSVNPTTGLISGVIAPQAYLTNIFNATVSVSTVGVVVRTGSRTMQWVVSSGINIDIPSAFDNEPVFEGEPPPNQPLTALNQFNLPVTFTSATGLPPGITFDLATATFGGTFALGAAQNGPYTVTIDATDGFETSSTTFVWHVRAITLVVPPTQLSRHGEAIDLLLQASLIGGGSPLLQVSGLPTGLTFNPATNRITGVIAVNASLVNQVTITATNGLEIIIKQFPWITLPVGVANYISQEDPEDHFLHEGDGVTLYLDQAYNSLRLPLTTTITGLPPGLTLEEINGASGRYRISGTIAAGSAANSPYQVQLLVTDGFWSDTANFEISVAVRGSVRFSPTNTYSPYREEAYQPSTYAYNFKLPATSSLNETITYSATGLPPGITINPQTGFISGRLDLLSTLPSRFQVKVTATTASDTDSKIFLWDVFGEYGASSRVLSLPHPSGTGVVTVTSPVGTEIFASISPQAGVALPNGVNFPFGFVTFAVRGLAPGQAADVIIAGLDLGEIENYYKYGATPANATEHWYNFLFGVATDGDSAEGTGMEIVGDTLVLHLVDGGRGDDDTSKNGVIFDIGGPAIVSSSSEPPRVTDVYVSGSTWDAAVRNSLGGIGFDLPMDGRQLEPLAWGNLNQIAIRFDQNVVVSQSDLVVSGINVANYAFAAGGFSYDPATFVARWTLAAPIGVDRVTLQLADTVRGAATNTALDGEWTDGLGASASGNGAAGGAFQFHVNVLPGDVTHDGQVNRSDLAAHLTRQFTTLGSAKYEIRHDLDGNGLIGVVDLTTFQRNFGRMLLPAESPPAHSPAAAVAYSSRESTAPRGTEPRLTARRVQLANKYVDELAADLAHATPREPSSRLTHFDYLKARRLVRHAVDAALSSRVDRA